MTPRPAAAAVVLLARGARAYPRGRDRGFRAGGGAGEAGDRRRRDRAAGRARRDARDTRFGHTWAFPGQGAGLVYDLAELPAHGGGRHVVAVALADMGNNVAAALASTMLLHFPTIEAIVMVGIAGGVPNPDKSDDHVRLGDVVVSDRQGVIQYDFVKNKDAHGHGGARLTPAAARAAARGDAVPEGRTRARTRPWEEHVKRAAHLEGAARPKASTDVLHAPEAPFGVVKHPRDPQRRKGQPRIFTGRIASGNVLLKDPVFRDQLREECGAKAVEMEGSGIADAAWERGAGYLVVRGFATTATASRTTTGTRTRRWWRRRTRGR